MSMAASTLPAPCLKSPHELEFGARGITDAQRSGQWPAMRDHPSRHFARASAVSGIIFATIASVLMNSVSDGGNKPRLGRAQEHLDEKAFSCLDISPVGAKHLPQLSKCVWSLFLSSARAGILAAPTLSSSSCSESRVP